MPQLPVKINIHQNYALGHYIPLADDISSACWYKGIWDFSDTWMEKIGTMCSLPSFALHHESLLCTSLIRFIHSQSNHSNMFSTKLNDDKESDKGNWGIKIICSRWERNFGKKEVTSVFLSLPPFMWYSQLAMIYLTTFRAVRNIIAKTSLPFYLSQ